MSNYLPSVTGVALIGPYKLRLLFDDGTVGDVDFSDHEWRGVFEPLRDPSLFAQVKVDPEIHTIVWPGDLDWAPETLYEMASQNPISQVAKAG